MFEKAVRLKLRFHYRGALSVEDLWDLHVESLDSIYKDLSARARAQQEDSLLEVRNQEGEILDLQINIVKRVVAVKLQEQEERENEIERRARKQKLLGILEEKQDAELLDRSPEELEEMILELG